MFNQNDWGQPRPRHQYTYHPRPYPGQKGVLTYSGPLNMTAAVQGYGGYGPAGYGYGYGAMAPYGAATGGVRSGSYGVHTGAYYPTSSSSSYSSSHYRSYIHPHHSPGHGGYYPASHYPPSYYPSPGYSSHAHYSKWYGYANCFSPWQATTVYRRVSAPGAPLVLAAHPASTAYVATTAATGTTTTVLPKGTVAAATTTTTTTTSTNPAHMAYVQAGATPTKLPESYHTANYSARLTPVPAAPTAEDIRLENRRVATERGAYRPRAIKPADALPDDMFWCREKDGDWHCRPYYQIENECYPGRWRMDAEHGFLVFHRE